MGLAAFNRRRRVATPAQPEPTPETRNDIAPQTGIPVSPALVLINNADSPSDLRPLPTVGTGAGKAVLASRPEGGYTSLDELPAAIFEPPYNCKRDAIAAWEG